MRIRIVVGLLMAAAPLAAQAPARWKVVERFRVDPAEADLTRVVAVVFDRNGGFIVLQPEDNTIRFYAANGAVTTFGRAGEGPGEFRNVRLAGWRGDTLWISDPILRRITLLDRSRKLVGTLPYPAEITGDGMANAPASVTAFLQAMPADGSLLLIGFLLGPVRPAWAMKDIGTYLLNVDRSGRIRRVVAARPPTAACSEGFPMRGGQGSLQIPFCISPFMEATPAGDRIVVASPGNGGRSPHFSVVALSAQGDTLFARHYAYDPIPVPKRIADSVRAVRVAREAGRGPDAVNLARTIAYPTTYPPFRRVIAGADGTVWIERWTLTTDHTWLVLDRTGREIGSVVLPPSVAVAAATADEIIATITDSDDQIGLVRYRIVR